jgi:serine/threonine protein phosphatase PrpC
MGFEFLWQSHAGSRTQDNRDYGGVGLRVDEALCVILDGATSGRGSGELARQIATEVIDWYVEREELPSPEAVIEQLRALHATLLATYPQGSASYMLVLVKESGDGVALYAGDCMLGRLEEEQIVWLCQPHTLANALTDQPITDIAAAPSRHRVTRSFRRAEFMIPDVLEGIKVDHLVMATDGFWADCDPSDQAHYLRGRVLDGARPRDDRSILQVLRVVADRNLCVAQPSETFYVRSRD